ncbi:MAG: glycosyltransferase family 9 protein [Chloroflexota bacterium]
MVFTEVLTAVLTKFLRIPFWLQGKRPFAVPKKLLILQPDSLPDILVTTPLLAIIARAFPDTQIDWAIHEPVRSVLTGNPHIKNLFSLGDKAVEAASWAERRGMAQQIQAQQYDTCIIPKPSTLLAWLAWQSRIPQRVGLHYRGQGFGYTVTGHPSGQAQHQTEMQMGLVSAMGLPQSYLRTQHKMAFYPSDLDRTAVTHKLVESLNWLGDSPLFLVNPGGAPDNERWPLERFVLLCNHLVKEYQGKLIIMGDEADQPLARELQGLIATRIIDWSGQLTLGEASALCEVADLYVGNNSDLAYIAAAADCPTVLIYGEKRPLSTIPYAPPGQLTTLWQPYEGSFSWEKGTAVLDARDAASQFLKVAV